MVSAGVLWWITLAVLLAWVTWGMLDGAPGSCRKAMKTLLAFLATSWIYVLAAGG